MYDYVQSVYGKAMEEVDEYFDDALKVLNEMQKEIDKLKKQVK